MADPLSPAHTLAEQIADQAARAVAAAKPLLILVFYRHETEKLDLIQALRDTVSRHGLCGRPLDPRHRPEHGTGNLYPVLSRDANDKTLSLVVEFPRGNDGVGLDPVFLEYLNLHRDKIAAERLRLVLFIPETDAEQFITAAGDLWDFRHHTYWLERTATVLGPELWQTLDHSAAALPVPDATREEVTGQVAQVRSLLEATEDAEDQAALLLDLTRWLHRRHMNGLAATAAQEGLALQPSRSRLAADLHYGLGFALRRSGHLAEALNHYEESLKVFREIGDRAGEGTTLNNISQIYKAWGRYDEALQTLQESLKITREIGDRAGEGTTLNNISQIYDSWGRYDEALQTLQESLKIRREIGDRAGEGTTLNNMAALYHSWGRYDEALQTLQESLKVFREIGDLHGEAVTAWNLAMEWQRRGELAKAIELCRRTVEIGRQTNDPDLDKDLAHLNELEARLAKEESQPANSGHS